MEKAFTLEYGVGGLCVLITLGILVKVAEILLRVREKKESFSDSSLAELTKALQANTTAMQFFDLRLKAIEVSTSEMPKLKTDIRRFYSAMKEIAGERWPAIRDEIMKDAFTV